MLLTLALALVASLAYQALDAARSHRRQAQRALRDYAAFAAWQLSQQARTVVLTQNITALLYPALRIDPDHLQETLLAPDAVGKLVRESLSDCKCLDSVGFFFRYVGASGDFQASAVPAADSATLRWARDTITSYLRRLAPLPERKPLAFGSADTRAKPFQQLSVIITNDSYVMFFGEPSGRPTLLVFVVSRDYEGKPVVLYGFSSSPGSYIRPPLEAIFKEHQLLPPSLVRGLPPDSVLAVSAHSVLGRPLFQSRGFRDSTYRAADTLESHFGRMVLSVDLRPEVAERLLVGGLPRSRLPLLGGLFLLTSCLIVIALIQLRRQQQLAKLRTDFVSGVSHELRTPLAQIRWFAELLHLGKLRTEEERRRSASVIDQEARRLTYLVENVLSFSRAERDQNRVKTAEIDVDKEVREALELFAPLARSRQMTLSTELEVGITGLADRDALRQVLLNLLDNAAKYGPKGQAIIIGTAQVGKRVRIWVDDEGPGIPEKDRERVFDPYLRLSRTAENATGGSGIGLSVVRELMELQGGSCTAEQAPGKGARLVIEIAASGSPMRQVDDAPAA
ncbi:MAG: hypothetical protein JWO05_151 [Gemmatimonadetes bacterium]|nr:hypothetical protein [Gemmatimonadota bacterium]